MIRDVAIPARLLVAALLAALVVGALIEPPTWLELGDTGADAADGMAGALADIPAAGSVLVGFDPDVGTFAELRPTVRAILDELAGRGTAMTFVSLTPEGRALAAVERARLDGASVVDAGFVAGAEAGLVSLARDLVADHDAILVVGGNDIGPRSWIEQVRPRVASRPFLAVVPTVLLPEVRPYVASGQLSAAITTPREGAELRARIGSDDVGPPVTALFVAMVAAVIVLLQAIARRLGIGTGASRPREAT